MVTTAFEHSSILEPMKRLGEEGFEPVFVKPDEHGIISAEDFLSQVTPDTILVSFMLVNNEVGTMLPYEEIAEEVRRIAPNATIHCDAVQAYGKLPLKVEKLPIDLVSMSGHKIHAPKGIGALYVKKGTRIDPIIYGGAQQNGLRPGTESLPLACGMGYAAKLRAETIRQDWETVTRLQAYAREKLSAIPGIVLNSPEHAFPYILNFSAEGIRSETHAPSSGTVWHLCFQCLCLRQGRSQPMCWMPMGLSHRRIDSAIRLSFNAQNTEADIDAFLEKLRLGLDTLARARS